MVTMVSAGAEPCLSIYAAPKDTARARPHFGVSTKHKRSAVAPCDGKKQKKHKHLEPAGGRHRARSAVHKGLRSIVNLASSPATQPTQGWLGWRRRCTDVRLRLGVGSRLSRMPDRCTEHVAKSICGPGDQFTRAQSNPSQIFRSPAIVRATRLLRPPGPADPCDCRTNYAGHLTPIS